MQGSNALSKILKLADSLSKQELIALNQAIISLIKIKDDVAFKTAAINFVKGDIVSFIDSNGIRIHGVVTKKNPKTIQVTTQNDYYVNIPATYLTKVNKPSRSLLEFRDKLHHSPKNLLETIEKEMKNYTLN